MFLFKHCRLPHLLPLQGPVDNFTWFASVFPFLAISPFLRFFFPSFFHFHIGAFNRTFLPPFFWSPLTFFPSVILLLRPPLPIVRSSFSPLKFPVTLLPGAFVFHFVRVLPVFAPSFWPLPFSHPLDSIFPRSSLPLFCLFFQSLPFYHSPTLRLLFSWWGFAFFVPMAVRSYFPNAPFSDCSVFCFQVFPPTTKPVPVFRFSRQPFLLPAPPPPSSLNRAIGPPRVFFPFFSLIGSPTSTFSCCLFSCLFCKNLASFCTDSFSETFASYFRPFPPFLRSFMSDRVPRR